MLFIFTFKFENCFAFTINFKITANSFTAFMSWLNHYFRNGTIAVPLPQTSKQSIPLPVYFDAAVNTNIEFHVNGALLTKFQLANEIFKLISLLPFLPAFGHNYSLILTRSWWQYYTRYDKQSINTQKIAIQKCKLTTLKWLLKKSARMQYALFGFERGNLSSLWQPNQQ